MATSSEQFEESGFKGITKFVATLESYEDGVPGEYGDQLQFDWINVRVLETETGEEFELSENRFRDWCKSSKGKSSKNADIINGYEAFAASQGKVGHIDNVVGMNDVVYERQTKIVKSRKGEQMSPGLYFIPTGLLDQPPSVNGSTPITIKAAKTEAPTPITDAEIVVAFTAVLQVASLNPGGVRMALASGHEDVLKAIGGPSKVITKLEALVAEGVLVSNDDEGTYGVA